MQSPQVVCTENVGKRGVCPSYWISLPLGLVMFSHLLVALDQAYIPWVWSCVQILGNSPLQVLYGSFRNESGRLCNNTLKHEEFYLFATEIVVSLPDILGTHYLLSGLLLIANKSATYY